LNTLSYIATVTPIRLIDFDHFGIILTIEYFFVLSINSLFKGKNAYLGVGSFKIVPLVPNHQTFPFISNTTLP